MTHTAEIGAISLN